MSPREYKRFLAYKEAFKIAQQVKRGLREVKSNSRLKSAYELANEL